MTTDSVLLLLLGILIFDFVFEKVLGGLNSQSRRKAIPKSLEGIYDTESYHKSQMYQSEVYRFSVISSSFSFLVMITMLGFGIFGWVDNWARSTAPMEYLSTLYFFGVLYITNDLISLPFEWYSTFVIEEKYGFNKSTVKTFFLDKVKGWLITFVIGGILLSTFVILVAFFESNFWIYFWLVMSIFMIFMNIFYTSLVVPLFNKLKPLEDGTLKSAINKYAERVGFPLNNIFVIDGSRRSSKGNAFFSGLGKKKKVVLYDTLIDKHTEEELVGILAHEIGHFKKKHILWSM
ncbi:MAG: M48 family metallopeptidase, partial [Bacteroidota bacterium]